jgi:hypothetical protein
MEVKYGQKVRLERERHSISVYLRKIKDKSKKTKVKKVIGYWLLVLRRRQQATSNKQQATSNKI